MTAFAKEILQNAYFQGFVTYGPLFIAPLYLLATSKKEKRVKRAILIGFYTQLAFVVLSWSAAYFISPYYIVVQIPTGLLTLIYYALLAWSTSLRSKPPNQVPEPTAASGRGSS